MHFEFSSTSQPALKPSLSQKWKSFSKAQRSLTKLEKPRKISPSASFLQSDSLLTQKAMDWGSRCKVKLQHSEELSEALIIRTCLKHELCQWNNSVIDPFCDLEFRWKTARVGSTEGWMKNSIMASKMVGGWHSVGNE